MANHPTPQQAAQILNNNGSDAVVEGGRVMSRPSGSSQARQDVTRETGAVQPGSYQDSVIRAMDAVQGNPPQ